MQKLKKAILGLSVFVLVLPSIVLAHPGNTDKYGCHTCRTNCLKWGLSYGEYHCHRAKALPQPKAPVTSKKATTKTKGITIPAPQYKAPVLKKK